MNLNYFQVECLRTWRKEKPRIFRLLNACLGLTGELGEIQTRSAPNSKPPTRGFRSWRGCGKLLIDTLPKAGTIYLLN